MNEPARGGEFILVRGFGENRLFLESGEIGNCSNKID